MRGGLTSVLFLSCVIFTTTDANPVGSGDAGQLMDYGYGYPVMDKKWGGRPSLQDYLKLAAVQYELDREEAENEAAPSGELMEPSGDIQPSPSDAHSVDKRHYGYNRNSYIRKKYSYPCCRRYGFWVSAINKMDSGHLKGFLGKHKNIYNIYKRSQPFPQAMANEV